ncbi:hypothetical protein PR048_006698 [Dryococelus australis]|uniref:Uncharacterized protein n=1 Tax=Dryococelus australis TaxID=614101 RepID=A0ABQ9IBR1_9NEOP|nr:hypothetical protein PR048_006698 [Dryococelus australis]
MRILVGNTTTRNIYINIFGQPCCYPFNLHKKVLTKGLKEVRLKNCSFVFKT